MAAANLAGGSVRSSPASASLQRQAVLIPIRSGTHRVRQGVLRPRAQAAASATAPKEAPQVFRGAENEAEIQYLKKRTGGVTKHFASAMSVDDFIQKVERSLFHFGFRNTNSIAMVNLCRDEVTQVLKHKIDQVFGSSFSTHGLGGILTCGVTGMGAGLSHSPICEITGKERYIFFSFPHIAIDSAGVVGSISRPGRAATSSACGAVIKSLADIKTDGLACNCLRPGVHEPEDVELSILKQRLARRLMSEGHTEGSAATLDLVELTKAAERTITADLEELITHAVDTTKADYAVVTGVQIHNWATDFDGPEPNLEFVAPASVYVVSNGRRFDIDLNRMPSLTPRQIRLLASAPDAHYDIAQTQSASAVCNKAAGQTTVREIDPPFMFLSRDARRAKSQRLESFPLPALKAPTHSNGAALPAAGRSSGSAQPEEAKAAPKKRRASSSKAKAAAGAGTGAEKSPKTTRTRAATKKAAKAES